MRRLVGPLALAALLVPLGTLLLGCGSRDHSGAEAPAGAALYGELCALCHGPNGEGGVVQGAPALDNQDLLAAASYDYLFATIADGRPGTTMSGWSERHDGPLSDEGIAAVIEFIEGWRTVPSVSVDDESVTGSAARGATIYRSLCASCHGEDGRGGSAPSLANPGFLEAATDGFIRYTIANGRRGTAMAAYQGELTEEQIDDLTVFVRGWQKADLRG